MIVARGKKSANVQHYCPQELCRSGKYNAQKMISLSAIFVNSRFVTLDKNVDTIIRIELAFLSNNKLYLYIPYCVF